MDTIHADKENQYATIRTPFAKKPSISSFSSAVKTPKSVLGGRKSTRTALKSVNVNTHTPLKKELFSRKKKAIEEDDQIEYMPTTTKESKFIPYVEVDDNFITMITKPFSDECPESPELIPLDLDNDIKEAEAIFREEINTESFVPPFFIEDF